MTDWSGNPYFDAGQKREHYDDWEGLATTGLSLHLNSLLALAWEQRTANLIAYLEYAEGDQYEAVWSDLQRRLGLSDE